MPDLEKAKAVAGYLFKYNDFETSKLIKELVEEIERLRQDEQDDSKGLPEKPLC